MIGKPEAVKLIHTDEAKDWIVTERGLVHASNLTEHEKSVHRQVCSNVEGCTICNGGDE